MINLTKNIITINEFIKKSLGEWKSIRSTHSLAFQEFENTTSKIFINEIGTKNKKVIQLLEKYNLCLSPSVVAISISWQVINDWGDDEKSQGDQTILIFIPREDNSGVVLRNKGYTESSISSSEYFIDENSNLHLKTFYNTTVSEERICFLSKHVRSRFSVIRNMETNAVMQTSHTSEIRKISI